MLDGDGFRVPGAPQSGFNQGVAHTPDGLRIQLLGRFEVRAGERVIIDVAWNRAKGKTLVKLLAVQKSRSLHREQVIETLWPGTGIESAHNNLRQTCHRLRATFGAHGHQSPVIVRRDIVALGSHTWTDIDAFRIAAADARRSFTDRDLYARAIELYAGDLLPDDPYEEWSIPPRDNLRLEYLDLLTELAVLHHCAGDVSGATELARQVVGIDPLREEMHRLLMRLYTERGDRARAIRQYGMCRDALQRELQIGVSTGTEALYRDVVEGRM